LVQGGPRTKGPLMVAHVKRGTNKYRLDHTNQKAQVKNTGEKNDTKKKKMGEVNAREI